MPLSREGFLQIHFDRLSVRAASLGLYPHKAYDEDNIIKPGEYANEILQALKVDYGLRDPKLVTLVEYQWEGVEGGKWIIKSNVRVEKKLGALINTKLLGAGRYLIKSARLAPEHLKIEAVPSTRRQPENHRGPSRSGPTPVEPQQRPNGQSTFASQPDAKPGGGMLSGIPRPMTLAMHVAQVSAHVQYLWRLVNASQPELLTRAQQQHRQFALRYRHILGLLQPGQRLTPTQQLQVRAGVAHMQRAARQLYPHNPPLQRYRPQLQQQLIPLPEAQDSASTQRPQYSTPIASPAAVPNAKKPQQQREIGKDSLHARAMNLNQPASAIQRQPLSTTAKVPSLAATQMQPLVAASAPSTPALGNLRVIDLELLPTVAERSKENMRKEDSHYTDHTVHLISTLRQANMQPRREERREARGSASKEAAHGSDGDGLLRGIEEYLFESND
ncbi:MAG: hypothetical protein M1833_002775 [Piccolia ochrophora]|nr:MAG: hypothetical protein M1833_002775 [Piccolia ochrophora]